MSQRGTPEFEFVRATIRWSFWALGMTEYDRFHDRNGITIKLRMRAVYIGPVRLLFIDWSQRWKVREA